jgi:radical SAM superfamily enzyme YgiQ (UPF0313 family)
MRILFVQPAPFEPGRLGLENCVWLSEPAAFACLAAMVPEHECKILDLRLEPDGVLNRELLAFKPDIVATTSMTTDCYQAKALLSCAKRTLGADRVFTMLGGHHPTLAPGDFENDVIDAVILGEGEDTFAELVAHLVAQKSWRELHGIAGVRFRDASGTWLTTPKRHQNRELDSFPLPRRELLEKYRGSYFFMSAMPMASIATSRGCSYDCNFCAIWEFYERKTRYLSAEKICDTLEQKCPEEFIMFLDDNFLSNRARIEALCAEIEKRGIKKLYGAQGRTDFIAKNPDVMKRLRDCGLTLMISGYETNDEEGLQALKKSNAADHNKKAADILNDLGIAQFGIFMTRPDFTHEDFDFMYKSIDDLNITFPIITVHTPLPGTQLRKKVQDELLTEDVRFFDLLHAVTPTKLPRHEFYARLTENWERRPWLTSPMLKYGLKRLDFMQKTWLGFLKWMQMIIAYRPVATSGESHLRDEIGIISADITMANAPPKPRLPTMVRARGALPILNVNVDAAAE